MWQLTPTRVCAAAFASILGACAGRSDTIADLVPLPDAALDGPDGEASEAGQLVSDAAIEDTAAADAGLCLGSLAAQTFKRAVCACNNLELLLGGLSTDAFDSSNGPYMASTALGNASHVGVNARLTGASTLAVGGNLTVADALGPDSLPALDIRGDLRVGGPFSYTSSVDVAQDLWLASDLRGSGPLHVAGNLIQAEAGTRSASAALLVDGSDLRAPVSIAEPCPCDAAALLDVQAIVAAAREHNDNATAGLAPDRANSLLSDDRIELPDGQRLFLTSINAVGNITFVVQGRSTLVVETFISVAGSLNLEIGPAGELDLFVGDVVSIGILQPAPPAGSRPGRVRVYVGGDYFHGQVFSAANIYAPRAFLWVINNDVYGSLFGRDVFVSGGDLHVHYDTSILEEGRDCDWFALAAAP